MKTARLGRLGLLLATLAAPAASFPSDPGARLRWPEVQAAVDQHPLVQEAGARARGAAGAIAAAGALPNPTVGISGGEGFARGGPGYRREWSASVELSLESLASRWQRVAAAEAAAEGAGHDARTARAQVLRELRRLFVALAHGQAVLEAGTELEGQVAQLAALVKKRADRGESRPSEVPRVEIELQRLQGAVERARAMADGQRRRLSASVGRPVAGVEADLALALALPPLEELLERARSAGPPVLAARARVGAASAEASAERWERLPKLSLGASHAEELDRRANVVSATVSLPLWSWNTGKIRQAEAALEAERARLVATSRELSTSLADAWQGCSVGQSAARRFQAEILPRAEASARTLGRAFELGEATLLDVIDARRVLLDTRREHLDLLLDMQNACGDLAALTGLELP